MSRSDRQISWVLGLVCVALFLANLGGPALFEPDEGRNAEKAREILVLNDWVTPHENFVPVLDKPMFFYWLVAGSFKLFGVSEWAARLPSALAALGCLLLVFRFAEGRWGRWVALWSTLILATCIEFFLLGRLVINDMTLTLFMTLVLCTFYSAAQSEERRAGKLQCLVLYLGLSAGLLIKGLVGLVIPGMICFFYLLLSRRWSVLRRMHLLPGAVGCLALVLPWYLWAEARNPGYLYYYFWDEHFVRYLTDEFNRSKSWYYFLMVMTIGFAPWIALLPIVARRLWRKLDDDDLFLVLWIALPTLFFSASSSQLPHYILPTFPALAVLTGRTIVALFQKGAKNAVRWVLWLPWMVTATGILGLALRAFWPALFSAALQEKIPDSGFLTAGWGVGLLAFYIVYMVANTKGFWNGQRATLYGSMASAAIFLPLLVAYSETGSLRYSAKVLATNVSPYLSAQSQLALYESYRTGLPFYLGLDRPLWVVADFGKSVSLGSPYVERFQPAPAPGYGEVFFTYEEFKNAWATAPRPPLVLLSAKRIARFNGTMGVDAKELLRADGYVLLAKP